MKFEEDSKAKANPEEANLAQLLDENDQEMNSKMQVSILLCTINIHYQKVKFNLLIFQNSATELKPLSLITSLSPKAKDSIPVSDQVNKKQY